MRVLFVFAIIKILELSRYNLAQIQVPRSLYDYLSFFLLVALLLYLCLRPRLISFEEKIEQAAAKIGRAWLPLLMDSLVIILSAYFTYKTIGILYTYPISCRTADMLPIIRGTGEFLLSLENPIGQTFCGYAYFPYFPMMIVSYILPLILKIDIRFVSLLCFLCILLFAYGYYRRKGYYLTGFFIFVAVITSGLFPLLMISVHTFPYLLLISIVIFALQEDKDKLLFFTLALTLAMRKVFWLYIPVFVIYFFRNRKITLPNLKFFTMGGVLGFSLFLFFPSYILQSSITHIAHQHDVFQKNLHLKHSIGLTYLLSDHRMLAFVIMTALNILIFVLAVKYLKKSNLWLFLFLNTVVSCYLQANTRSQEYYFIPLIIFILFAPLQDLKGKFGRKNSLFLGIPVALFFCLGLMFYPYLSGIGVVINPVRGGTVLHQSKYIRSAGYLEISVSGNLFFQRPLILVMRRTRYSENKPVRIKIKINEKDYLDKVFQTRKIEIPVDKAAQKRYFYIGANSIEIITDDYEEFYFRVRSGGT